MDKLREFIELHAMYDGKRACIRAASIDSVLENAEEVDGGCMKKACRTVNYSGHSIDVVESYDSIIDMIWEAEM